MNDTVARILFRLSRGPATEGSLARWLDMPQARFVRRYLQHLLEQREIRRVGEKYALPFNPLSPAGPVVIGRGFRWWV